MIDIPTPDEVIPPKVEELIEKWVELLRNTYIHSTICSWEQNEYQIRDYIELAAKFMKEKGWSVTYKYDADEDNYEVRIGRAD